MQFAYVIAVLKHISPMYMASQFGSSEELTEKADPATNSKTKKVRIIIRNYNSMGNILKCDCIIEKTVSNKRSELNLILEQFNIQIDNPCNILMQDKAREFLANSSSNSKYQVR